MRADLGRGNTGVIESDHVVICDAGCSKGLEEQVGTVILRSAHQQAGSLYAAVYLLNAQQIFVTGWPLYAHTVQQECCWLPLHCCICCTHSQAVPEVTAIWIYCTAGVLQHTATNT